MIYNDRYILKTGHSLLAPIYEPPLITHNHTFFEFSFIRRGHCTNVINNIRYPLPVESAHCFVLPIAIFLTT